MKNKTQKQIRILTTAAEINQWGNLGTDRGRDKFQIQQGIILYQNYLNKLTIIKNK